MTHTDQLLMATAMCSRTKRADFGNVAETVGYFTPGVSTGLLGRDSWKAFREGRPWSGVGNAVLAGASLIPGASLLGMGLRGGARLAKGIGMTAKTAPRLANAYRTGMKVDTVLQQPGKWLLNKVPGGRTAMAHPFTTGVGLSVPVIGANAFQAKLDAERAVANQLADRMRQLPSQVAGMNPLGTPRNPMFLRPGGF